MLYELGLRSVKPKIECRPGLLPVMKLGQLTAEISGSVTFILRKRPVRTISASAGIVPSSVKRLSNVCGTPSSPTTHARPFFLFQNAAISASPPPKYNPASAVAL